MADRAWTRDDLPHEHEVWDDFMAGKAGNVWDCVSQDDLGAVLNTVVEHLNEHHPKPPFAEEGIRMIHERDELRTRVNTLECDRDRWRRAHEIVEQERDQARATVASLCERLAECSARAEAAEARTAPAVTKADIEKAIRGKVWAANREPNKAGFHRVHVDWATDAVCGLFGVEAGQATDPVEDAAVAAFKAAWHRADEEGDEGNRVRRGIRAARHVLGQEAKR